MAYVYTRGNTLGNLQNKGLIVDYGKYIYFYLNGGLYRMNKENNEKILIYKGETKYLNVTGDFIYCVEDRTLYRIAISGEEHYIAPYYEDVEEISIVDQWIYCHDSWSEYIFRINMNNSHKDEFFYIDTVPFSMAVDNENVYFSSDRNGNLEVVPVGAPFDGDEGKIIGEDIGKGAFYIHVEEQWIYYLESEQHPLEYDSFKTIKYHIYKIRKDGTNKTKIVEDYVNHINVQDGWIYFSNRSEQGALYKMKIDGTNKIKLSDDVCENIHLVEDWVYYYVEDKSVYRLFQEKLRYFQSQNLSFEEVNQRMNEYKNGIFLQRELKKLYRIRKDGTFNEEVKI